MPPALAPPAPAVVATDVPLLLEDPALRRRADEVVALIAYPWGELGYEALFLPARPGMRARTLLKERRIEIYVRFSDPPRRTAFDLVHEIAHAFDFTWGSPVMRARWQQARDLTDRAWFGCNACDDLATPAGDFAESFAAWQVPGGGFSSQLGPPPTAGHQALLAELTLL